MFEWMSACATELLKTSPQMKAQLLYAFNHEATQAMSNENDWTTISLQTCGQ
jgi:hypothetical protein